MLVRKILHVQFLQKIEGKMGKDKFRAENYQICCTHCIVILHTVSLIKV